MSEKKNKTQKDKFSNSLIIITAILTMLYALSFTKSCSSQDSREKIKTTLVNPKYKASITSIELSDATASLNLTNMGSFWTVDTSTSRSEGNNCNFLPVSPDRIKNLMENMITIRNLYKISDKITEKSTFGLNNGTEFHIRYYTEDGFHELIFGNQDFSLSSRYMMTEKSSQVYEIDNSMDTFLTTSIQSWAEPFIISQVILGKITPQDIQRTRVLHNYHLKEITEITDLQKLLELRHGGIPDEDALKIISQDQTQLPQSEITLELGNKNEIELQIYESGNENEFIVITQYKRQKNTEPFFISASKISSWTYNKINEITL